ncbi:MAG: DNA translocase FtsK [Chloroflexota bacterium]
MAPLNKQPVKKERRNQPVINPSTEKDWLSNIQRFKVHFGRFLWDATGVVLIAFGLLILVGIVGMSKGILLTRLIELFSIWLGWGILIIVFMAFVGGVLALKHGREPIQLNWTQVVYFELACILSLAVLSIMGGNSLSQVENGWWGGRLGWALVVLIQRLIGEIAGIIIIVVLWIIILMRNFGLWEKLENWLKEQAGEKLSIVPDPDLDIGIPFDVTSDQDHKIVKASNQKPNKKVSPEFRKSLVKTDSQDGNRFNPQTRGDRLPPLNILESEKNVKPDERNINQTAGLIEQTLSDFGIPARVVGFRIGPTVTQFAVEPGFYEKSGADNAESNRQKVRIAQIAGLSKDLALVLSAERLRIEAPVPGRSYVGIEVPNLRATTVRLRPLLESESFYKVGSQLGITLGRDVSGHPVVADLARMPHILIAGTTGSGKSVCISALATCLAMNNTPEDLKLVMIDSKMVELIRFNGLPHMLGKVETEIQRILGVLRWTVVEMEHRYKLLEAARVRDLDGYNKRLLRRKEGVPLPRIVVLIDELADLMMSAPDQTEHNLVRLAQMARATGIHLIVATQRPSAEVVTGLIKANFPSRISFAVASGIDSRVILDSQGAETLLGHGDMLFLNPEIGNPIRAQGVFITDQEIERMISFWQESNASMDERPPWETLLSEPDEGEDDVMIEHAIVLLKKEQRASASMLQRRLRIGYPRAARLLDRLEEMGIVGPSTGGGRDRDVLINPEDDFEDELN